jgi:DNA-binding LacI/PurR family transcriptional regulator
MNLLKTKLHSLQAPHPNWALRQRRPFLKSDASLVLADWNEKAARSAAEELTAQGHKAFAILFSPSSSSRR